MIEKTMVQWTSQKKLRQVLSDYPGLVDSYLKSEEYRRFVDNCHVAVNRLELSQMIPSKAALELWIGQQACVYCEKFLAKAGNQNFKDTNPENKPFEQRLQEGFIKENFDNDPEPA